MKVPFTRALTVLLTKDAPVAQKQADDDLKAIENGSVFRHPANEAYFHRLRRRVAEKPELTNKIVVFYQDKDGKLHEIELASGQQLRWPPGFMSEIWDEEVEIMKLRALTRGPRPGGDK